MTTVTVDPEVEQIDAQTAPVPEPDPQPKRKRRTFTLSDEAYETLTASSEAQGTNRSRLIEDLIMQEHRTVALSDDAHELLTNAAEAFGTDRKRLAEELVNRTGAILAWQTPEPVKTTPWWMFWRRNSAGGASQTHSPVLVLPSSGPEKY